MSFASALAWLRGSLAASRLRLLLTIACIALGVAMGGAVHTVHSSALAEIDRAARTLSGTADEEIRGPRSGFDEAVFLAVAARPEVLLASPVVEVFAPEANDRGVVRVQGIDVFRAARLQAGFAAGSEATNVAEAAGILDPAVAWISPPLATRRGLRKDSILALRAGTGERRYRVAGILPGLASAGEVAVIDIAAAQEHFDRVGRLTRIDLRLKPGVDAAAFRRAVSAILPAGVAIAHAAEASDRAAGVTRAYRVNLDALALVALATGAFMVFSTLALQAARRRQELALLRALGLRRRDVTRLVALEGAVLGAIGAAVGTAIGLALAAAMLARTGADLGAGFFASARASLAPDPLGLVGIALLAIAVSVLGALQVARHAARIDVAEALRDRAVDLPQAATRARVPIALALAGVPFLFAPPVFGLPLGGYAAIGFWLAASVAAVPPLCRFVLARLPARDEVTARLAVAQVRHLPGHLSASIAGIVVSASLCIAMAIMVHSFRLSVERWLGGVVRGDLYVTGGESGNTTFFDAREQAAIANLPGVASVEPLRFDRIAVASSPTPLTLVARPIDAATLAGFQAQPAGMPRRGDAIPVWISEATRELHRWHVGDEVRLPIAGRDVRVRVAGVIRDFARTWGAVMIDTADYRALTGDVLVNDLVLHLRPGADGQAVSRAIREALPGARGLSIEDAAGLRRRSLEIFDRSFAITYALEAIAIAIGVAGVTSSFAALAWSRRREFGLLRFVGFTRAQVLRMLALEGAAVGLLGAVLGLASGAAMSAVLVHVVNRQSFHWQLDLVAPPLALAALVAGIVLACTAGARLSGAHAVRREAVLAVKEDA